MSLSPGSTLGRYEIRALLGTGGMGEVFKAYDPTLGRFVALKLLRHNLSGDDERITRFLQEARAASALNHPNILTIHEVGNHNQSRFIVSEFVEGETLRQRMERGQLSLREVLDIAIQTASALAAAHAAGIVHRDIKPENLMLRPDGYVKVLDFGVAKLGTGTRVDDDPGVTIGVADTGIGMVVGTMAYMAPEQARGLHVDGRADSFSLGVVLYELVAGRQPFAGATSSDVLVAVLDKEPPPLRVLARGVPLELEWIISKALEKDPNLRYQGIADLRVDLLRLKSAIESGRVAEASAAGALDAPVVDQPIEVELTDDSPQVRAISTLSMRTAAIGIAAMIALIGTFFIYHRARPGSTLPLHLPKGAVITKARDALATLGYTNPGSRHAINFDNALDLDHVVALAGSAAALEAVRTGAVAHWEVAFTQTRDANELVGGADPQEGDYALRLDPAGKIVSFATGVSANAAASLVRDHATKIGLETLRRVFTVDASAYELEFVQRAFPAGTVEMRWRNPQRRFGHHEQFRVDLQGERVVRLDRSFEKPPGFTEPKTPAAIDGFQMIAGFVIAAAFVAAWVFGLIILVKTRNWDALRQRLPIAICAMLVAAIMLESIESATVGNIVGVILIVVLLGGTVLPALSGIVLWMRRRNPARLWSAEQLSRGRVRDGAVALTLIEGVLAGVVIAAVIVVTVWLGLQIEGYVPSISRELDAVDKGLGSVLGDALAAASFLAIGVALAVEALDWARVRPTIAAVTIAVVAALLPSGEPQSMLALLPPALQQAAMALILVIVYRTRGLLAVWLAVAASGVVLDALAARSLDDADRLWLSNMAFMLLIVVLALGVWGVVAQYLKGRRAPLVPA